MKFWFTCATYWEHMRSLPHNWSYTARAACIPEAMAWPIPIDASGSKFRDIVVVQIVVTGVERHERDTALEQCVPVARLPKMRQVPHPVFLVGNGRIPRIALIVCGRP